MKNFERLLVVIDAEEDFSTAQDGLPIEIHKALRFVHDKKKVEIKLLSVGYEKYLHHSFLSIGYEYTAMRKEYMGRMGKCVGELADRLRGEGYQVASDVVWAHPRYETIVKQADEYKADLVIQHCRLHAKIEHYHLTNDSWQLVRYCRQPLLLVRDSDWAETPIMMAAVDPLHSHNKPLRLDHQIIQTSLRMSEQVGAQVHVVHAYGESARPFAVAGKIEKAHSDAFEELMADFDIPQQQQHLIDETPVFALLEYSKKLSADIIVMGAISRSRLTEAMIGSTAERALDYIKTDILVLKPEVK